jgi:radical SAM superfamily enzyme YgiQ (UPF0313 family)
MVATALMNAGHEVHLFDFLQHGTSLDAMADEIKQFAPEIVGVSVRNIDNVNLMNEQRYVHVVKDIVQRVRLESRAPVVLGGSGFSLMPELILREVEADYGIVGEGEELMVDFLTRIARGEVPRDRCIRSDSRLTGEQIPSASYDEHIMAFYLKSGKFASIQTKRGCTHNCIYCSYPLLEGSAIRPRNPQSVVADVERLVEMCEDPFIVFTDSVFNDEREHYLTLVREMKNRGLKVPWTAFFRPQGLDHRIMKLMKETGLKAAEIGPDASTDATLSIQKKGFRFEDVIACNELFADHEITTAHFFMFGGPGETRQTVLEGIENVRNLRSTVSFIFLGIRILPDTPLVSIARKEGLLSRTQELLEPAYYVSPSVDKQWLEETLADAFRRFRHCVFPPDAMEDNLKVLHKLGYSGCLYDLLIPGKEDADTERRRERHQRRRCTSH